MVRSYGRSSLRSQYSPSVFYDLINRTIYGADVVQQHLCNSTKGMLAFSKLTLGINKTINTKYQ